MDRTGASHRLSQLHWQFRSFSERCFSSTWNTHAIVGHPSLSPSSTPMDTVDRAVQDLDEEMMSIIDRKDFNDRVTWYNQVLQQHNALSGKRSKEPERVVAENDANESIPVATEAATGAVAAALLGRVVAAA